jgi:glucokinase
MTIAVDIDGSNFRAGTIDGNKFIRQNKAILINNNSLPDTVSQRINLIKTLKPFEIHGNGIGVPFVLDIENGIVFNVRNTPSWKRVSLKDTRRNQFKISVQINNGVNCLILGEHRYDLAKQFKIA